MQRTNSIPANAFSTFALQLVAHTRAHARLSTIPSAFSTTTTDLCLSLFYQNGVKVRYELKKFFQFCLCCTCLAQPFSLDALCAREMNQLSKETEVNDADFVCFCCVFFRFQPRKKQHFFSPFFEAFFFAPGI